ncbi:MAG: chaperone modulator CbpM [Bacteroidia bacterium]
MKSQTLIPLSHICSHFELEMSFFTELQTQGLIEISIIESDYFIEEEIVSDIERIIRLHHDLNINLQGIDVILNLLDKMKSLEEENIQLKNRLRLFE